VYKWGVISPVLTRVIWRTLSAFLAIFVAVLLPTTGQGKVVINEIMANNATFLPNDLGQYPDWVELYNASSAPVDISGYRLSDTVTNAQKFIFPANTRMGPFGYLVVWCDPTNTLSPGYHTGFSLKSSGETVALFASDGVTLLDSITFGIQVADLSIGRYPDGTNGVWTLNRPTHGTANELKPLESSANLLGNLFINEWVATNASGADWIELYNRSTNAVALAGLVFTSTLPPAIPTDPPIVALSFIDAGGFIQFNCIGSKAKAPDELDFKLSHNTGETVTLYPGSGMNNNWINQISFPGDNTVPNYWPTDAANVGVSYGRLPDGSTNIVQFSKSKTTPAASNFQSISNVVINEALTHTDPPVEDAIELYNPTTAPADISGW
jgi:hypothetical protein